MSERLVEELLRRGGRAEIVLAIAEDIASGVKRYAGIDSWCLATEVLDIDPSFDQEADDDLLALSRVSMDDYGSDATPVADHIGLILDQVNSNRAEELRSKLGAIACGKREADIEISDEERRLLEDEITRKRISDGAGWIIRTLTLDGESGAQISFQVCIGDAGEPFDLLGPYELAEGETNFTDDLVFEEE
jgi:hypothetical protein